jgi:hypothetical protein
MRLSDRAKNVTHVAVFREVHSIKHERPGDKDPMDYRLAMDALLWLRRTFQRKRDLLDAWEDD